MNGMIFQTVVETPEFIMQTKKCMIDKIRDEFIDFIAKNPEAGEIIEETGGARKIRWQSSSGNGKRAGLRIIYFFYDEHIPIYLFTVYKKTKQEDITHKEKKILYKIIKLIVKAHKGLKHDKNR